MFGEGQAPALPYQQLYTKQVSLLNYSPCIEGNHLVEPCGCREAQIYRLSARRGNYHGRGGIKATPR